MQCGQHITFVWSCSEWGLQCLFCCQKSGELLPRLFTLSFRRYIFCCTFPRVASAGCYPAFCPVEPGLSSPANIVCGSDHFLDFKAASSYKLPHNGIVRYSFSWHREYICQQLKQSFCLGIFLILRLYCI